MPSVLRAGAVGLLASATLALELGTSTDVRPQRPAALTRRTALFVLPALAVQPQPAWAGQVGGAGTGGLAGGTATQGGGPPKLKSIPPLTKGEPGPEEIRRLALGYQRLKYLLENWEKETTVCIKGCKGKYEACGCTRDPVIVQAYMGYKSMEDPLFKAGDLMLRASSLVKTDSDFEKYTIAMEKWNNQADE